ncbi:glycoside hydrolase family 5 protein [Macrolepiota fuliginosa MF-IS2]|uniref:Glycoside hydrolase family 5 protein n=1 Tax=Macrolepiota fuliginosa MF-IS2 TaxID=1400762 RepID=A0A9P5XEI0_9AGAR|nr:glycoside hydrolase family 5 protein [Macrolepiota fuliginosa MF-IS2]
MFAFLASTVPFIALAHAAQCSLRLDAQPDNAQVPFATAPSPAVPSQTTTAGAGLPSITPFDYSRTKVRGVNLGGWFVLEPWITPSIFEQAGNENIVDEFTLGQMMDPDAAQALLKSHWQSWITEDDFAAISAAGLNHVRIPIGYWSVPLPSSATNTSTSTAPYTPGAWPYILRALSWSRKHGIHVILDLHGAPGSQNGYDNSGQRTSTPVWGVNPSNITRTIDTLRWLTQNVGGMIDTIELLNEAAGFIGQNWADAIRQFWLDGYDAVRAVEPPTTTETPLGVMIGDAFLGLQAWTNFLTPPRGESVLLDLHSYQIFSDLELNRTLSDHVTFACTTTLPSLTTFASSNVWTVVGEWSTALTDCAKWLNGRGSGARWDGTWFPQGNPTTMVHGSCDGFTGNWTSFSDDYLSMLRQWWEVQVEIAEAAQGWIYWTWKTESADEWSYQKGLEGGWIPQDPTERKFPNICGH